METLRTAYGMFYLANNAVGRRTFALRMILVLKQKNKNKERKILCC